MHEPVTTIRPQIDAAQGAEREPARASTEPAPAPERGLPRALRFVREHEGVWFSRSQAKLSPSRRYR
jgi:hypothetical protein